MIRINPVSAMVWWLLWIIPLAIGFRMYLLDEGLAWQRTEKIDANKMLIRAKYRSEMPPSSPQNDLIAPHLLASLRR